MNDCIAQPYKIYNGDCMDYLRSLPDESIDTIITDPPYRTITGGNQNGKNSVRPKGMLSGNRKLFDYQNTLPPSTWFPEIFRVAKNGSHIYVFTNVLNLSAMLAIASETGFELHNLLVWEKNNCTPSQFYMKNCEYILFLRKGKAKWINNIGASKTVHRFDNIIGKKQHPTEKPVPLLRFYIENSTNHGDVVLDPFMGSGSTGVAAVEAGRKFIGCEIDKQYYDIAEQRLRDCEVVV